eukprot:4058085-Amphidinium_carterae.4
MHADTDCFASRQMCKLRADMSNALAAQATNKKQDALHSYKQVRLHICSKRQLSYHSCWLSKGEEYPHEQHA